MTAAAESVPPRLLAGDALVAFLHAGMDERRYRDLAATLAATRFERDDLYAYRAPGDAHYVPVRRNPADRTFRRSRVDDRTGRVAWYGPVLPNVAGALYRSFTDEGFGLVGSYPLVPADGDADVLRCCVTDLDEKERHADGVGGASLSALQAAYRERGIPYHAYGVARSKGGKGYHVCTLHPRGTIAFAALNLHRHLHAWAGLPRDTETYPRAARASTRDRALSTGSGQYALPGSLHWQRRTGGSVLLDPLTLDPIPMREWAERERAQLRVGFPEFCEAADAWGVNLLDPRLHDEPRAARAFERCLRREATGSACTPERLVQFAAYFGLEPGDLQDSGHPAFSHHVRLGRCPREHLHSDAAPGNARLYVDAATGRLGWNCHHNGCRDVSWRDMRKGLDPTGAFALGVRRKSPGVDPRTIACPCSRCAEEGRGLRDDVSPGETPRLWRLPGAGRGEADERRERRLGPLWAAQRDAARHAYAIADAEQRLGRRPRWLPRLQRVSACRKVVGFDVCRNEGCGGKDGKPKAVRVWVCESSYCARCGPIRARIQRDHVLSAWRRDGAATLEVFLPDDDGFDVDPLGTAGDLRRNEVREALNGAGLGYVGDGAARWLLGVRRVVIFAERDALATLRGAGEELRRRLPTADVRVRALGVGEVARLVERRLVEYNAHVVEVLERAKVDPTILDRAACLDPDARRVRTAANAPGKEAFPWKTQDAIRADAAAKAREANDGLEPGTCPDCRRPCHHVLEFEADAERVEEFPPGTPPWRIRQAALSAGACRARAPT